MSMLLAITHRCGYRYSQPILASYSEARLTPLNAPGQSVLSARLDITPHPYAMKYRDYWGTQVTSFEIHAEHSELRLEAMSQVLVSRRPTAGKAITWEQLQDPRLIDRMCEYLEIPETIAAPDELAAEVHDRLGGLTTPAELVGEVCDLVNDRLAVGPGKPADVAADAWAAGSGTDVDLAHLCLAAIRSASIPARFVFGYRHPDADPAVGRAVDTGAHAWIEWWDGTWIGLDPRHLQTPDDRYVALGTGRDYQDVVILRGIYTGGTATGTSAVTLTRLE